MLNAASKSIGARAHSPRGQGAQGTTLTSRRQVAVTASRKPNASDLKDNFRRGPLDGIGTYVSEAFAQIFSGTAESVPWCVEIPVMTRLSLSLFLSLLPLNRIPKRAHVRFTTLGRVGLSSRRSLGH